MTLKYRYENLDNIEVTNSMIFIVGRRKAKIKKDLSIQIEQSPFKVIDYIKNHLE